MERQVTRDVAEADSPELPDWVDTQLEDGFAMRKLSSYLRQPQLSLAQAVSTFKECFLGE